MSPRSKVVRQSKPSPLARRSYSELSCGHVAMLKPGQKTYRCKKCETLAYPPVHTTEIFKYFHRSFDISKAWQMITKDRAKACVQVSTLKNTLGLIHVDSKTEHPVDLSVPLLAVDISQRTFLGFDPKEKDGDGRARMIIDGWHRVAKALEEGVESLDVYVLNEEETKEIMR
jgi:hypothetical protein